MKKLPSTYKLSLEKQKLLASHIGNTLNHLYSSPITSKVNLLDKSVKIYKEPGENILNQTLIKGSHARVSFTKKDMLSATKQQTEISTKIMIENTNEKSDLRFLPELLTASRYAETSDLIKIVTLNSEENQITNILSKIQTGNNRADIHIQYFINNMAFDVTRDIKSGNNMFNISQGILGEVPYTQNGKLYSVINEPLSLLEINTQRVEYLKKILKQNHDPRVDTFMQTQLVTLQSLEPLLQQGEIIYNNAVQQQLYAIMAIEKKVNFALYYGVIVKEIQHNTDFFSKLQPHIRPDIFNNKQAFNTFMAKACIIYHNTVNPILNNVQKTKGTVWEASYIDNIKDDIFS